MSSADFKLLHTMMRVMDLEKSINFYTKFFNMNLIRKADYPGGKFTLAFLGYGPEESNTVLELTHNWEQKKDYEKGNAWGHIAIGVRNIYDLCSSLKSEVIEIIREPGPMKHGKTIIAFIKDPDNYSIELIQKK